MTTPETAADPLGAELRALLSDFEIHLEAKNRSHRTIGSYVGTARLFAQYCATNGRPTDPAEVTRRDVESFISD